jgi:hypothetical protein
VKKKRSSARRISADNAHASKQPQLLAYRDKFRSLHNEDFQFWFEELARALHPAGDFQAVRKTQGDGGLDGFVISSRLVYQVGSSYECMQAEAG